MRAVSLFSGAGGFEIGLERAGIETVLQAECDPRALAVLRRHWREVPKVGDVRCVGDGALASAAGVQFAGQPDLIYGGFPCQDVSVAGRRAGLGGERSGLWSEFRRVLSELRPRWCLVENVPGLHSSAEGEDFTIITAGLAELGYGVAWRIWDARFFRVPQRRRRVFIVGLREPGGRAGAGRAAEVLALCESCGGHPAPRREAGQDATGPLGGGAYGSGRRTEDDPNLVVSPLARRGRKDGLAFELGEPGLMNALRSGNGGSSQQPEILIANSIQASAGHHGHSSPRGDGSDNLIAAVDFRNITSKTNRTQVKPGLGLTLHAEGQSAIVSNGIRRLTPLECERLMGWPDEHTRWTDDGREIPDSHRYRLCGNGVVSTVAEWIGHRLAAVDAMLREKVGA